MKVSFETETQIYVVDVVTKYSISSKDQTPQVYLCKQASDNNNRLNFDEMVNQGWPKPNIARLKKTGQEKFNLWDSQGFLTEDGIQASEEGIVHVPENGKLRLWVINHPIAGIVPIHATEEANLPIDQEATNKDNNAKSCLIEIHRSSRFKTLFDFEGFESKWFELLSEYQNRNWFSNQTLSTKAKLTWTWRYEDGEFIVDDYFNISGKISGLPKQYSDDQGTYVNKVTTFGPYKLDYENNSISPQDKFREWLSKGEYSASPWDIKHGGMRRPLKMLTDDEKMRQTIHSIELIDNQIMEWDSISIDDVPLIAANETDATDWSHFLLKTLTPGYTSRELTDALLSDILKYPAFSTVNSSQIAARVKDDLESQIGDPRMQKLIQTADDMDSSFIKLNAAKIRRATGGVSLGIDDGKSRDYSNLITNMTANMKGRLQSILLIDNHTYSRDVAKSLGAIKSELARLHQGSELHILTRHWNETLDSESKYNPKENREKIISKLKPFCNKIVFLDDVESERYNHHRYVRIRTDKEDRWFTFNDTILSSFNRDKDGWIIDDPSARSDLKKYIPKFEQPSRGNQ